MNGLLESGFIRSGLLYFAIVAVIWLFNPRDPEARERDMDEVRGTFVLVLLIVGFLMLLGKIPLLIPVVVGLVLYVLWKIVRKAYENARR